MDATGYITPRVEGLIDRAEEIHEVAPGVFNRFSTWSALKLILQSASVNMYTTVMANQPIEDTYYIDALAGSGVSRFEDGGHFLGSSLLACRSAREPFSKMYFVEYDEQKAEALRARLDYAFQFEEFTKPDRYEVINGDANDEIPRVTREIRDRSSYDAGFNYFGFIDNQGMNVTWDTIMELTPTPHGDLLINLPVAQAIGRNLGTDAANAFYGFDTGTIYTGDDTVRERLRDIYQYGLAGMDRSVQTVTKVQADVGSYYYDLIYATRFIPHGNGYMEVIDYVRDFIEQMHSGNVDQILEVIRGDQEQLSAFLPDNPPEDEMPEEEEDDNEQATLGDF